MQIFPDCTVAYGQSDEFSFVLRPDTKIHGRRRQKLVSLAVSKFTAVYQFYWAEFFPDTKLLYPPSFDGRMVLYPNEKLIRDYLSWRQVDCHINNLYNTAFHSLIKFKNLSPTDAEKRLSKTLSKDKVNLFDIPFYICQNLLQHFGTLLVYLHTVHDLKLSHFFPKKLQKGVTIWEHLPKRYYFWTIIKQKRQKV